MKIEQFFATQAQMDIFGEKLAHYLKAPLFLALEGQLGAGKTTFVRAILRAFGYGGGVKSPTYTLVESYELSEIHVFHLDLYRVKQPCELEFLGIEDIFQSNALCIIEWPKLGEGFLPQPDLNCQIEVVENEARYLRIDSFTDKGEGVLRSMMSSD